MEACGNKKRAWLNNGIVIADYLELHAAFGCNLSCESCSHYSNQNHKGNVSLEEMKEWVEPWRGKLRPCRLNILGGEPFLNPDLGLILDYLREAFDPMSEMYITTNGLLLDRSEYIKDHLRRNNVYLSVSMHAFTSEYMARINPIRELLDDWSKEGIEVHWKDSVSNWTRRYHGWGDTLMPFEDEDPQSSWNICKGKHCVQLFRGKLWKCAPLAYLKLQDEKYNLDLIWDQYLKYQGLEPTDDLETIVKFYERGVESYCSMCPAHDVFFLKDPFSRDR